MASTSSPIFNGSSTYAAQLQQVITHAVAVASLPLAQLQTTQTTLGSQQTELQAITSSFSSMQTAIASLESATGAGAFSASASDSSVATASLSTGAMAGSYLLNVTDIGAQTNTISQNAPQTVTDPSQGNIDSSATYTLSVNGKDYAISDASGTLNGLAEAITNSAANVQATVVNVGSSSSPDYRLSVQSLDYAPDSIQLSDGTQNLLQTLSTGSNVAYQVNGQPDTPISSSTRNVTISPGLTVDLLKTGSATVTVAQSSLPMANALSSFANAYNSVVAELNKNRGQAGGALSGQSIIYQLENQLRSLAGYSASGNGSINSLTDLGLSFDQNGNLQFDSSAFDKAAATSPNDLLNFIGTASSGGFLASATAALNSITDPRGGVLAGASQTLSDELSGVATRISDDQTQITQLQQKLTNQMANVDATISSLQQQLTEVTDLFLQMQTNARLSNG